MNAKAPQVTGGFVTREGPSLFRSACAVAVASTLAVGSAGCSASDTGAPPEAGTPEAAGQDGTVGASDSGTGIDASTLDQTAGDAPSAEDALTDVAPIDATPAQDAPTDVAAGDALPSSDAAGDADAGVDASIGQGGCGFGTGSLDSGESDAATADGAPSCGALGAACCSPYFCQSGLVCTPGLMGERTCQCPEGNCCAVQIGSGGRFLGIDSNYLYWSGVTRAPLDGGPPSPVTGAGGDVFWVGRTSLYFFGGPAAVSYVPLAGGPAVGITNGYETSNVQATWLAADDVNVYVAYMCTACGTPGPVIGVPLSGDGGSITVIGDNGDGHFPSRVIADGTHVYWRTPSAVVAATAPAGSGVTLASADASGYVTDPGLGSWGFVAPLSMDSSSVYTIDGAKIVRIAKATGTSSTVVTAGGAVAAVVADSSRIYWAESVSQPTVTISYLKSAPLSGGSPVTLAADFYYVPGQQYPVISDVVVNDSNVFWVANGQVWRLAK